MTRIVTRPPSVAFQRKQGTYLYAGDDADTDDDFDDDNDSDSDDGHDSDNLTAASMLTRPPSAAFQRYRGT